MIKFSTVPLFKSLIRLLNFILETGIYPDSWCRGIITPIFKSGSKVDPGNYRGICVAIGLGKVLCSLLNNRILKHLQLHNPIHKSQIGFQAGSRTSDHLFTLKTLIDSHVKAKSHGKISACFVGFRKAFDSTWHQGVFYKLLKSKVGGNVDRCISKKCIINLIAPSN